VPILWQEKLAAIKCKVLYYFAPFIRTRARTSCSCASNLYAYELLCSCTNFIVCSCAAARPGFTGALCVKLGLVYRLPNFGCTKVQYLSPTLAACHFHFKVKLLSSKPSFAFEYFMVITFHLITGQNGRQQHISIMKGILGPRFSIESNC
jgi:hypothetical protein